MKTVPKKFFISRRSFFIFLILFCGIYGQNLHAQKAVLSRDEVEEDLQYLHEYLEKWHPSYYRYASAARYDSLYRRYLNQSQDSISYRSFRYMVSGWVKEIKCGHTSVGHANFPKKKSSPNVIPLQTWYIDGRLFVRDVWQEGTTLKRGDEIVSILGYPSSKIIDSLSRVITGDGFQQTHVQAMLEKYFLFYVNHVFGPLDTILISTADNSGKISKDTLFGIEPPSPKKRPERFMRDSSTVIIEGGGMSLHSIEGFPSTYILKVTSFSAGPQAKTRKKIFRYLKNSAAKHVVLDLRGNGGGNVFQGYSLAEQLLPDTKLKIQFGKKINLAILDSEFETDLGSRLSGVSFMLNPWQWPRKGLMMHYFPIFTSYRNRYEGDLYVLTDGGTFSMGSSLASLMKYKRQAFVVGEETGGNAYGSGGMLTGAIRLPHSGIPVSFNLYWFEIGAAPKDTGRGVIPDIKTRYSIQDRLESRDVDVEWVLKKIKETEE